MLLDANKHRAFCSANQYQEADKVHVQPLFEYLDRHAWLRCTRERELNEALLGGANRAEQHLHTPQMSNRHGLTDLQAPTPVMDVGLHDDSPPPG